MNIRELKKIIKDVPDDVLVQFCTRSMHIVSDVNVEFMNSEEDTQWYGEPSLVISSENIG